VGGAVSWVGYRLMQKYLIPHLTPPSSSILQSSQSSLQEQHEESLQLLRELQTTITDFDDQKKRVDEELEKVRGMVRRMEEAERDRRGKEREIETEVRKMKDNLPKLLEDSRSSTTTSLTSLSDELKSLKSLVSSAIRTNANPTSAPQASPSPLPLPPQVVPTPSRYGSYPYTSNATSSSLPSSSPFNLPKGGLPDWQRKKDDKKDDLMNPLTPTFGGSGIGGSNQNSLLGFGARGGENNGELKGYEVPQNDMNSNGKEKEKGEEKPSETAEDDNQPEA